MELHGDAFGHLAELGMDGSRHRGPGMMPFQALLPLESSTGSVRSCAREKTVKVSQVTTMSEVGDKRDHAPGTVLVAEETLLGGVLNRVCPTGLIFLAGEADPISGGGR
ncbi:hypothetical protein [Actinomadura miaoliensis]|uniref:Uncharacterized protein n=1 Tax=Actinomadura miaoliensis TaxID=430685 RepID=A0ABP7UUU6_9ACTN